MFDGGLAISIRSETVYETPEWQVQLFSRQGDLKRQLIGDNEDIVLKTPEHLASNADEDILYISDRAANAVIGINPRGSVLFTFMSTSMFAPRGLSVDLEGHFYVACDQGVIQIHKDGKQFRMILRLKDNKTGIQTFTLDRVSNCLVTFEDMTTASKFRFVAQLTNLNQNKC
ncbi:hypothetical protein DPMN_102852 [Dreissena polymorpha]|uniref:SMP-30/Gluconolactonase/LRE-like region domain-containing protein n=1 Tax=Dreissena polymorpha TaxID=45954 RepID=A0A9D4JYM6_DREPO|nr:hypothetical protein DPMN_102852 [Dreissena polymorpha]